MITACGCTSSASLADRIEKELVYTDQQRTFEPNTYTDYWAYYTASDTGTYERDQTGTVFNYDGTVILMNMNMESILHPSEDITFPTYLSIYPVINERDSTYVDADGAIHRYKIVLQQADNCYLLILMSDTAVFTAATYSGNTAATAAAMLKTARSIRIDKAAVESDFSKDSRVNYLGQKFKLFDNMTPEKGMISEIIEKNNDQSAQ